MGKMGWGVSFILFYLKCNVYVTLLFYRVYCFIISTGGCYFFFSRGFWFVFSYEIRRLASLSLLPLSPFCALWSVLARLVGERFYYYSWTDVCVCARGPVHFKTAFHFSRGGLPYGSSTWVFWVDTWDLLTEGRRYT